MLRVFKGAFKYTDTWFLSRMTGDLASGTGIFILVFWKLPVWSSMYRVEDCYQVLQWSKGMSLLPDFRSFNINDIITSNLYRLATNSNFFKHRVGRQNTSVHRMNSKGNKFVICVGFRSPFLFVNNFCVHGFSFWHYWDIFGSDFVFSSPSVGSEISFG